MGKSQTESLVRDVSEACWASRASWACAASAASGAPCDRLLKLDLDATARSVFDGLLGLDAEAVVL